ncbi:hypothetical protein ABIA25_001631 [Sinorhizobium fredii]|uniref:hypothetical protein n=1 Tax=Rhizobium fredii TaxID=380 RepID=UPI003512C508
MTAALGLIAILSGCAHDEAARLDASAASMGRLAAGVHLPEWPALCREPMPAVVPKLGEKARHSQSRWEVVREQHNQRVEWCGRHYDGIAEEYARPRAPPD